MAHQQDFLDEDPAIRGQSYVCLSFLSPEDVIVRRDAVAFNKYVASFANDVGQLFDSLNERFKDDSAVVDMLTNVRNQHVGIFDARALNDGFDYYKAHHADDIDEEFERTNAFKTSVRGIKVRGTYDTFAEAENRCKQIKRFDPKFDVYVAQVGCWCPWAPRPEVLPSQEFAEEQLNTLMKKYTENLQARDELYRERVAALKQRAGPSRSESLATIVEADADAFLESREADADEGADGAQAAADDESGTS